MTKEKDFDLAQFFASRQELVSINPSVYAHRQLSVIREMVQEQRRASLEAKEETKKKTGGKE